MQINICVAESKGLKVVQTFIIMFTDFVHAQ
jgi:hypothetical protein